MRAQPANALLRELVDAVEARRAVVVVTVVSTERSVPRRAGSKMLVHADGSTSGSIGGGEMEARAVAAARESLASGRPARVRYSLLDPASGDPGLCGGEVDLYLEPHMPQTQLFVAGAGHVGTAVVELAVWLGYRVVVWDDRPELLAELLERVGDDAVATVTGPIAHALAAYPLDQNSRVVMVTRNVDLDLAILPELLGTDVPTLGLMGSRRRWETTRARLLDAGIDPLLLEKVHSPIGVEIGAETPAEIAVSVLAEVIGANRGHTT